MHIYYNIYIYTLYPGGAAPRTPRIQGGLRPPDSLHLGGCALKPLHPGGLRSLIFPARAHGRGADGGSGGHIWDAFL